MSKNEKITASEAVFGFTAWLTTRKQITRLGSSANCNPIVKLIEKWIKENNLPDPRKGVYPHNITQPID